MASIPPVGSGSGSAVPDKNIPKDIQPDELRVKIANAQKSLKELAAAYEKMQQNLSNAAKDEEGNDLPDAIAMQKSHEYANKMSILNDGISELIEHINNLMLMQQKQLKE